MEKIETRGRPSTLNLGVKQQVDRKTYGRLRAQVLSIRQQLEASGFQFASIKLTKDLADAIIIARVLGVGYTYDLHGDKLVVTPNQKAASPSLD